MEEIGEIPTDKFVMTSYNKCYDVDDLVDYLLHSRNKNTDPLDQTGEQKIWENEDERIKLISHPGLDPEKYMA